MSLPSDVFKACHRSIAAKNLRNETINAITNDMVGLKEQNTILSAIKNYYTGKVIEEWNKMSEAMTANTYKFARKAFTFSLPIHNNLKRWKKVVSDLCPLCNRKQTQIHVLNNCSLAANSG